MRNLKSYGLLMMLEAIARQEWASHVIVNPTMIDGNTVPLREVDFNTVHRLPPIEPKIDNWKDRKSKGEKKRQRSQWNSQIKGYRK